MQGPNDNLESEIPPEEIQPLNDHVEHKSFKLTGGWKLCMNNKKPAKKISLKQALYDGAIMDVILFFVFGSVMCGTFQMIVLLAMVAHVFGSIYLACKFKEKVSALGISFIRFGSLYLIPVAIAGRALMVYVFELMNIDWYY